MKKYFLAISIPESLKLAIEKQIIELKKNYPNFRWIPKENYHITINYFGIVKNLDKLVKQIDEKLFDTKKFYLYSNHLSLFIYDKIVIYLGFEKERLLLNIKTIWSGKKDFIPHITVARAKIPSKQQYFVLKKRLLETTIMMEFCVDKLTLFESLPGKGFPIYNKVVDFPLQDF